MHQRARSSDRRRTREEAPALAHSTAARFEGTAGATANTGRSAELDDDQQFRNGETDVGRVPELL